MSDSNTSHIWTEATWQQALYQIFERSCEDPNFRQACVDNPRAAFEEVAGLELPPEVNVTFDASQDSATVPDFNYAFVKRQPVVVMLPQTKKEVGMTSK